MHLHEFLQKSYLGPQRRVLVQLFHNELRVHRAPVDRTHYPLAVLYLVTGDNLQRVTVINTLDIWVLRIANFRSNIGQIKEFPAHFQTLLLKRSPGRILREAHKYVKVFVAAQVGTLRDRTDHDRTCLWVDTLNYGFQYRQDIIRQLLFRGVLFFSGSYVRNYIPQKVHIGLKVTA